jgi:hypothetical protein
MQNKKVFLFGLLALIVATAIIGSTVSAATKTVQNNSNGAQVQGQGGSRGGQQGNGAMKQGQTPGVVGTVSAINGNSITVTGSKGFNKDATATAITYTIDATNAKVTKDNTASTVASIAVGDTVMVQGTVSGTNITATAINDGVMMGGAGGKKEGKGVSGTVASISGTTLTVTSKAKSSSDTSTTYTVDASDATVTKDGATSSVSAIAVGDTVIVQGTVSGTSVTATKINDGASQDQSAIQGNGQPVVAGSVNAISGTTITITNKSNVTYTIDATNATFVVTGITAPTISNIAVGDNLTIQGTVNGTSVVASSIIDQKATTNTDAKNSDNNKSQSGFMGGMMSSIGNFFKHLFGF